MEKIYYPEFWRDAVPEDATKDPPMTARFTHYPNGFPGNTETVIGFLRGVVQYKSNRKPDWFDAEGNRYVTAQVYDPPVGFEFDTSKYRLIGTRIEAPSDGDQEFNCGTWVDRPKSCGAFDRKKFYRRLLLPNAAAPNTVERAMWNGKECFVLTRFNVVPKAHSDGTASLERVILQEVHDDDVPLRFAFAKDLLPITPKPQFVK